MDEGETTYSWFDLATVYRVPYLGAPCEPPLPSLLGPPSDLIADPRHRLHSCSLDEAIYEMRVTAYSWFDLATVYTGPDLGGPCVPPLPSAHPPISSLTLSTACTRACWTRRFMRGGRVSLPTVRPHHRSPWEGGQVGPRTHHRRRLLVCANRCNSPCLSSGSSSSCCSGSVRRRIPRYRHRPNGRLRLQRCRQAAPSSLLCAPRPGRSADHEKIPRVRVALVD